MNKYLLIAYYCAPVSILRAMNRVVKIIDSFFAFIELIVYWEEKETKEIYSGSQPLTVEFLKVINA